MTTIVSPYYYIENKNSQIENSIHFNSQNPEVDSVVLLVDRPYQTLNKISDKIKVVNLHRRIKKDECDQFAQIHGYTALDLGELYYHQRWDCVPKFNLNGQTTFSHHRSGWGYAVQSIQELHNPDGVIFDGFLEKSMSWDRVDNFKKGLIPYKQPWVGVIHNPPNMPRWFNYSDSPQVIFQRDIWKASAKYCKGLFCLSKYHADWLRKQVDVPVEVLTHPSEVPNVKFNLNKFKSNKSKYIIQIGWWLRRFYTIFTLPPIKYKRLVLTPREDGLLADYANSEQRNEYYEWCHLPWLKDFDRLWDSINRPPYIKSKICEIKCRVDNNEYDELLSKNIVFLDLYDSSANNVIIECIVRNTPILVRRLPAVEEYLGENYPFYFNNQKEIVDKLSDSSLIEESHEYLVEMPKYRFSGECFKKTIIESEIYKNINI